MDFSSLKFFGLVSLSSEPGRPFERDARVTCIAIVDVDVVVDVDVLDRKVGRRSVDTVKRNEPETHRISQWTCST